MKRLGVFLSLVLLCGSLAADVDDGDWRKIRQASERDDVSTWVQPVPDNPLNAFKGEIEVPHPMERVMIVLGDIERFPEWVFQCDEAELRLDEWGPEIVRIKINGIWPVSDRDAVARSTIEQDPETLAITIRSFAEDDILAPQDGYVRIPSLDNLFVLTPLDDGWTRVTFRTFVDPGGAIPKWLANFVATRAPLWTLQNMYKQMQHERYQEADFVDFLLPFPGIEDLIMPSGHRIALADTDAVATP